MKTPKRTRAVCKGLPFAPAPLHASQMALNHNNRFPGAYMRYLKMTDHNIEQEKKTKQKKRRKKKKRRNTQSRT